MPVNSELRQIPHPDQVLCALTSPINESSEKCYYTMRSMEVRKDLLHLTTALCCHVVFSMIGYKQMCRKYTFLHVTCNTPSFCTPSGCTIYSKGTYTFDCQLWEFNPTMLSVSRPPSASYFIFSIATSGSERSVCTSEPILPSFDVGVSQLLHVVLLT